MIWSSAITDHSKGPKRRAVVSAKEGPNVRVSNLVGTVLNKISNMENSEKEEKSTEGLLAKIETLNKRLQIEAFDDSHPKNDRSLVAGSLDFINMYGSFKAKESADIVRKHL